jgi:hypothetical protein
MATLIFRNKNLQNLLLIVEQASPANGEHKKSELLLVKDEGIYLMTSIKLAKIPENYSHICYAEGFEADAPGSNEKCANAVSGNDFAERFAFSRELQEGIRKGYDLVIDINGDCFSVSLATR